MKLKKIEYPDKLGDPIIFNLSPRGTKEKQKRDKAFAKEQARIQRAINRGDYGIPVDWIINRTGAGRYFFWNNISLAINT